MNKLCKLTKIGLLFWTMLQKSVLHYAIIDFFALLCNNYGVFQAHIASFWSVVRFNRPFSLNIRLPDGQRL